LLHLGLRRWQPALDDLTRAADLGAADEVAALRGQALAELGRWPQARDDFARARAGQPADGTLAYYHALTLLALDDLPALRLALDPKDLRRYYRPKHQSASTANLAWVLALTRHGDASLARELIEQALTSLPKDPNYLNTLGLVEYRLQRYPEAVAALRRAQAARGGQGTVHDWLLLALAHARQKDANGARKWWEQAQTWFARPEAERRDPAGRPLSWSSRLELEVLRREAQAALAEVAADKK
jgi:tetratricopeptide (TPR) repeat protein